MKEGLLEMKQTPACVGNLPKKPTTKDKTKPLDSQKMVQKVDNLR